MTPALAWTKNSDGSYVAKSATNTYVINLLPQPVYRYVVSVDGVIERAIAGSRAGQPLQLYYLADAKMHCQDRANGGAGIAEDTQQRDRQNSSMPNAAAQTRVPFPGKDEVIAAVRAVTPANGRIWPIVDRAWDGLLADDPSLSGHAQVTLESFVLEVATWGRIRRWLTAGDPAIAARALWDIRGKVTALRGTEYSGEGDTADAVCDAFHQLIVRMQVHGMAKRHYSLSSKMLHWLLPGCAPVYDSQVLRNLRIGVIGTDAYRQIITWEYACAEALKPDASDVLQGIREMTLLAAVDNYLWWSGKRQE